MGLQPNCWLEMKQISVPVQKSAHLRVYPICLSIRLMHLKVSMVIEWSTSQQSEAAKHMSDLFFWCTKIDMSCNGHTVDA